MKKEGFTFIEIVVSISIFMLSLLPIMELNRELLKTERRFEAIERGRKNFETIEKQIRGRGYEKLKNSLGKFNYEFKEGEREFLLAFDKIELLFPIEKGEKVEIEIKNSKLLSEYEEEEILYIKIVYHSRYREFISERVVTQYEKYYEEE